VRSLVRTEIEEANEASSIQKMNN